MKKIKLSLTRKFPNFVTGVQNNKKATAKRQLP